jgi:hypothetical protein
MAAPTAINHLQVARKRLRLSQCHVCQKFIPIHAIFLAMISVAPDDPNGVLGLPANVMLVIGNEKLAPVMEVLAPGKTSPTVHFPLVPIRKHLHQLRCFVNAAVHDLPKTSRNFI